MEVIDDLHGERRDEKVVSFASRFRSEAGIGKPADPSHYMPEVVSFWETEEWKKMKRHYNLGEQTFNQSCKATKPPGADVKRGGEEKVSSSKELSRGAPGMMKKVATQLQRRFGGRR